MIEAKIIGDREAVVEFASLPPRLRRSLLPTLRREAIQLVRLVRQKLSGPVLRNRTGHLRASIGHEAGLVEGDVVAKAGIFSGPTLIYGRAHEFGFDGVVQVRGHTRTSAKASRTAARTARRLRRTAKGLSAVLGQEVAVDPLRPVQHQVRPHSRQMRLQARSFLRTALAERTPAINAAIATTVERVVEGAGG